MYIISIGNWNGTKGVNLNRTRSTNRTHQKAMKWSLLMPNCRRRSILAEDAILTMHWKVAAAVAVQTFGQRLTNPAEPSFPRGRLWRCHCCRSPRQSFSQVQSQVPQAGVPDWVAWRPAPSAAFCPSYADSGTRSWSESRGGLATVRSRPSGFCSNICWYGIPGIGVIMDLLKRTYAYLFQFGQLMISEVRPIGTVCQKRGHRRIWDYWYRHWGHRDARLGSRRTRDFD